MHDNSNSPYLKVFNQLIIRMVMAIIPPGILLVVAPLIWQIEPLYSIIVVATVLNSMVFWILILHKMKEYITLIKKN